MFFFVFLLVKATCEYGRGAQIRTMPPGVRKACCERIAGADAPFLNIVVIVFIHISIGKIG